MVCRGDTSKNATITTAGVLLRGLPKTRLGAASVMSNRDPIQYRDIEWVPYAMGAVELPQSVHQQSRT